MPHQPTLPILPTQQQHFLSHRLVAATHYSGSKGDIFMFWMSLPYTKLPAQKQYCVARAPRPPRTSPPSQVVCVLTNALECRPEFLRCVFLQAEQSVGLKAIKEMMQKRTKRWPH
jgi:hypothetical protein